MFGTTSESTTTNGLCHIKMKESTVAVDMSEFWTTESMGVSVKSCPCGTERLSRPEYMKPASLTNHVKKIGNKWQVSYPWKKDLSALPHNSDQSLRNLKSTEH